MRTTIRLDDELLREAKRLAAETNQTLTAVIEEALRERLARRKGARDRPPFTPKVYRGPAKGLQPGVDLDDNAALLDLMEGRG
ncbi:type II toxin-antitoxin system VapB family antitoxin [Truepera radiovictrix]|uniref:Transcriptional regulator, CopG family n=1 Tax=Truepera radiovictrix (strain DSM 17093 / CIP 108686 / LMG 22925 / RQ-24) TaxID=649638 RepID=D7CX08_TRURR|nr:type II toxin-antitoxin system VapB family antitoxin [Truepera radiovictrix]ADI14516.1 transcriptional regulator, CopG family [Truepera radiovictrix DSM 17093]WMT56932.1 type II toxin-antitoxin system VapB family antitoxin [Truepera radiovictrix]